MKCYSQYVYPSPSLQAAHYEQMRTTFIMGPLLPRLIYSSSGGLRAFSSQDTTAFRTVEGYFSRSAAPSLWTSLTDSQSYFGPLHWTLQTSRHHFNSPLGLLDGSSLLRNSKSQWAYLLTDVEILLTHSLDTLRAPMTLCNSDIIGRIFPA